jgi:hypothetical protein
MQAEAHFVSLHRHSVGVFPGNLPRLLLIDVPRPLYREIGFSLDSVPSAGPLKLRRVDPIWHYFPRKLDDFGIRLDTKQRAQQTQLDEFVIRRSRQ